MTLPNVLPLIAALLGVATLASAAPGQAPRDKEPVALFDVAFYGKGANSLEPGDPLVAAMTDSILRSDLQHSDRLAVIDSSRLTRAVHQATIGGSDCETLECRLQVSRKAGATWMVTSKLSKTSNLIWYLSGQLTDVASGKRLLDDEFELKGIAEDIAKGGAHSLARRIVRAATSARAVDTPAVRLTLAQLRSKLDAATEDKPPDLSKADLSGLNLSGVDFKRANLAGARLAGTKLVRANLFTADLTDAMLADADLSGANLDGSVLRRANLQRADLQNASLFATIIESADLSGANLGGARIIGYLRGANLSGASLRHARAGADPGNQSMGVMRATFVGADLSGADLSDADLFKADLSHAKLINAKLARANLMNADLIQTDLTRADLTDAKLAKANIDEAIFTQAVGVDRIQGLNQARNREKAIFDASH
ncbi:MAG: pentapeptide repeat-containing protein [Gemmatimonadales bacterium]